MSSYIVKSRYTLVNGRNTLDVGLRKFSYVTNVILTVPYKDITRISFNHLHHSISGDCIMMYDSVYRPDIYKLSMDTNCTFIPYFNKPFCSFLINFTDTNIIVDFNHKLITKTKIKETVAFCSKNLIGRYFPTELTEEIVSKCDIGQSEPVAIVKGYDDYNLKRKNCEVDCDTFHDRYFDIDSSEFEYETYYRIKSVLLFGFFNEKGELVDCVETYECNSSNGVCIYESIGLDFYRLGKPSNSINIPVGYINKTNECDYKIKFKLKNDFKGRVVVIEIMKNKMLYINGMVGLRYMV